MEIGFCGNRLIQKCKMSTTTNPWLELCLKELAKTKWSIIKGESTCSRQTTRGVAMRSGQAGRRRDFYRSIKLGADAETWSCGAPDGYAGQPARIL
jgi:hypothetical protein